MFKNIFRYFAENDAIFEHSFKIIVNMGKLLKNGSKSGKKHLKKLNRISSNYSIFYIGFPVPLV